MKLAKPSAIALAVMALAGCQKSPTAAAADNVQKSAEYQADAIKANGAAAADTMQAEANNEAAAVRAEGENAADAMRGGNSDQ